MRRMGLKVARVKKDYTQGQLAGIIGVSQQSFAKWEGGLALPKKLLTIKKLELLLETPKEELFPDLFGAFLPGGVAVNE